MNEWLKWNMGSYFLRRFSHFSTVSCEVNLSLILFNSFSTLLYNFFKCGYLFRYVQWEHFQLASKSETEIRLSQTAIEGELSKIILTGASFIFERIRVKIWAKVVPQFPSNVLSGFFQFSQISPRKIFEWLKNSKKIFVYNGNEESLTKIRNKKFERI